MLQERDYTTLETPGEPGLRQGIATVGDGPVRSRSAERCMLYRDSTTRTDEVRVTPFHCGPFANESERTAFEHLKSRIESSLGGDGDHWILLTNLTWSVTHQFQADEIDMVAIGPPGRARHRGQALVAAMGR